MTTPLPPIEPYLEKCGKGTAWIGSMIREQMTEYAQQAAKAERKAVLLWAAEQCGARARALRERASENGVYLDFAEEADYCAAMLCAEAEKIK